MNGNEIYYIDVGASNALPVILIHGFPFNHEMWEPQIEALKNRFRVIAYDLRGHGKSGVGDGQYTLEFFVDDLIGLLDHLKVGKAVLCGLSMGGYIALRAIERNPDRVMALILADTQAKADSNDAKLRRAAAIRSVKSNGVNAYAENFVQSVFAPPSFTTKSTMVDKIKRIIQSNSSLGICGALLAMVSRTDTIATLPSIKVATLILVGEMDKLTPVSASQEMKGMIPNCEFHVIQNTGPPQ